MPVYEYYCDNCRRDGLPPPPLRIDSRARHIMRPSVGSRKFSREERQRMAISLGLRVGALVLTFGVLLGSVVVGIASAQTP